VEKPNRMLIADILRKKGAGVETVDAQATLQDAVQILARRRIGALLISKDGRHIDGILSERDVVRALAQDDIDFATTRVSDLMVTDVHTAAPNASVSQVMELMDDKRIRHVPIVVDGNVLAGVVSIRDIVNARLQEAETEREQMADYIANRTAS